MGFCALGLGFMKKNNRKMGMGFQFEQHRLGLWGLSWDLKKNKTISWEMGLGTPTPPPPPLHDPLKRCKFAKSGILAGTNSSLKRSCLKKNNKILRPEIF